MPLPKRESLGVRLSLGILVFSNILPIATVAAVLIFSFYQRERDQLIAGTVNQVRAVRMAVDREFESAQAALMALSTSSQLEAGDYAGFHTRVSTALKNMRADSIVLVGMDGRLLLSTRRPYGSALPRIPSTPLLQRIVTTGKPG